jgi:CheY-like chemotaxis protein
VQVREASPTANLRRLRRPRVLVVDDDPDVRLLCATNLTLDGFDVIEAGNGQEGLERVGEDAPDLVLLDISMPVLDGFELATAVRRNHRTSHVPLVFLTGEATPDAEERAFAIGAAGYFTKPFDPAAVSRFIADVLAGSSRTPDAVA